MGDEPTDENDDEAARRLRAEQLRADIAAAAGRPPRTPREFTEEAAREAAAEQEEREGDGRP